MRSAVVAVNNRHRDSTALSEGMVALGFLRRYYFAKPCFYLGFQIHTPDHIGYVQFSTVGYAFAAEPVKSAIVIDYVVQSTAKASLAGIFVVLTARYIAQNLTFKSGLIHAVEHMMHKCLSDNIIAVAAVANRSAYKACGIISFKERRIYKLFLDFRPFLLRDNI